MPAVTFDVWLTLVYLAPDDEERYFLRQVEAAVEALRDAAGASDRREVSDADLARAFERALKEAVAEAAQGRSVPPAQQLRWAGESLGLSPSPGPYLSRLAEVVARQPFHVAPGALELLRQLHEDGYRIGTVGNTVGETGASMRKVLAARGFDRYVEAFMFSAEHPWSKPSPEIFWEALRRLGERPAAAVHVGDAWFDIEGARRARLRAGILFTGLQQYGDHYRTLHERPAGQMVEGDHVVARLDEMREIVGRILPISSARGGAGRNAGRPR